MKACLSKIKNRTTVPIPPPHKEALMWLRDSDQHPPVRGSFFWRSWGYRTIACTQTNTELSCLKMRFVFKKKKSKQTKSSGKSAEVCGRALKRRVILQWDSLKPMWSVLTFPPHPPPSLHPPLLLVVSPGRDKGWTGGLFWTVGAVQMFATHNHTCNRK